MILYLGLLIFELVLINRILKFNLLSPVYLYLIFYTVSICLSLGYFFWYEPKISLYNFDYISRALFFETINLHLLALVSFGLGVFLFYDFASRSTRKLFNKSFTHVFSFKLGSVDRMLPIVHGTMVVVVILCAFTFGSELFYRDEYLTSSNKSMITLLKLLCLLCVLMLGAIFESQKNLSIFYFCIIVLIAIGTGSRQAVVYSIVYSILIFISSSKDFKSKIKFGLHIFISFIFLSFIISVRRLPNHGLIPYISSVFNDTGAILDSIAFNIYYSFIFGVYVSAETITENTPNWSNIAISINPLPGKWVGWYDIASSLRSNRWAPFSLNGEIFTMGKLFTFVFYTLLGIVFAFFEKMMRYFFNQSSRIFALIIALICALFVMFSFEYNLRSSIRYLYYGLIIVIMYFTFGKYNYKVGKISIPKKQKTSDK